MLAAGSFDEGECLLQLVSCSFDEGACLLQLGVVDVSMSSVPFELVGEH